MFFVMGLVALSTSMVSCGHKTADVETVECDTTFVMVDSVDSLTDTVTICVDSIEVAE